MSGLRCLGNTKRQMLGKYKFASDQEHNRMATPPKTIDPRVKRTRQLLQQAFFEVMREKGFAAMTVQDITERATVNRGTFYAHFTDKYALLDAIIREQFQTMLAR